MLGYVKAERPELKVKEFEMYSGYYCGVCKSISKNHGQLPRLSLSYDAAFLAALIDGLDENTINFSREHCIIHHIKKKTVGRSKAIDYAADTMLLLGYHKLEDDYLDEKKIGAKIGTIAFKNTHQRIAKKYPQLDSQIKINLENLHQMEKENEGNLDKVAEPFAKIIEEIVSYYFLEKIDDETTLYAIRRLGYMLGKWIYIIDALDDIDEDIRKMCYNPFMQRLKIENNIYNREELANIGERNLYLYGSDLVETFKSLKFVKNEGIVDNVLSLGLLRRAETVISEIRDPNEKINNKKEQRKICK